MFDVSKLSVMCNARHFGAKYFVPVGKQELLDQSLLHQWIMVNSFIGRNIIQLHSCVCFVFILLLHSDCIRGLSLLGNSNDRCQKCIEQNRQLETILERRIENVKQSCVYVKEFLRCAEPLESSCRSNLNFQGALTLMRSFKERHKCASMNITVNEAFRIIDQARRAKHNTGKNKKQCRRPTFKPVYKICGLFGDPHLRTFSDKRHTCSVPGAWPLFANRYLTVQVTNIPLENSSRATATSKVWSTFNCYRFNHHSTEINGFAFHSFDWYCSKYRITVTIFCVLITYNTPNCRDIWENIVRETTETKFA